MKDYKRLTEWVTNKITKKPVARLKDKNSEPVTAFNRLADIEDKIESGELISTKETGDTEIEFFCKHNDTVRKDTAQRALVKVAKAINAIPWSNVDYEKSLGLLGAVEDIAKEYGVELVGISDKLGGMRR